MFLFNIFLSTYLFCLYIAVCVVWIVVYFIQQLFLTHSVNKQSFKYVTIILIVLSFFNFNILSLKHPTLPITFVYSLKLISLLELFLLSSVVSALKKQSENIFSDEKIPSGRPFLIRLSYSTPWFVYKKEEYMLEILLNLSRDRITY